MRGKYKTKFSLVNFKKLKKYIKKIKNGKSKINGQNRVNGSDI